MALKTSFGLVKARHPEWADWISVVEEAQRELANDAWDGMVPALSGSDGGQTGVKPGSDPGQTAEADPLERAPLLAGTAIALRVDVARRCLERLIKTATRRDAGSMASLAAVRPTDVEIADIVSDALNHESARTTMVAVASGANPDALQAVAALVAVPLLHACRRRWSSRRRSWIEGRCFVCGAWPSFAEVRGIERSRHFRCGRCASEWHARALRCPYCTNDNHDDLETLVPNGEPTNAVIEGCRRCGGYVKTFTRLQACATDAVSIEDLATVHLDVAALEEGFARPPAAPLSPAASVRPEPGPIRRFRRWELGIGR